MQILLIEDNELDAELTREALGCNGNPDITVVGDGAEAMALLRRMADGTAGRVPDLVLLDLRLPNVSGHDILTLIKGHENLKSVPVVVVSSSENPDDLNAAYAGRANCYVVKPLGADEFIETLSAVARFWFRTAKLPSG